MIGDAETRPHGPARHPVQRLGTTRTRLAWTGDGARGWRTITPRQIPAGRIRGAFFLDQRTGWVVASAKARETGSLVRLAVYRTTDGGATWRWYSLGALVLGKDDAAGGYDPGHVDPRNGWVSVLDPLRGPPLPVPDQRPARPGPG